MVFKMQNKFLQKLIINILNPIIIFAIFYLIFYLKKDDFYITTLSHIDILTAMDWLKGQFNWLGPQIPYQTGNLPGPFFYFLIIPPLLLKEPYTFLILYTIAWLSLTFTSAFYFVKNITKNQFSPVLFLILLLTSNFFIEYIMFLPLNNLFSILFHLVIMISLFKWQEKKNDLWLLFIGLFMGLGIQIHHSILFHLVICIVFLITDPRIQTNQFGWKYLLAFVSLFLLPQTPFLFTLLDENREVYIRTYDFERINWLITYFFANPLNTLRKLFISLDMYGLKPLIRALFIFILTIFGFIYKKRKSEKYFFDDSIVHLFLITIQPILLTFLFIDHKLNAFFLFLFSIITFVKFYDSLWPKNKETSYIFLFVLVVMTGLSSSLDYVTDLIDHANLSTILILYLIVFLFLILYISFRLMNFQELYFKLFFKIKKTLKIDQVISLFYKLSFGLLIGSIIIIFHNIKPVDTFKKALKYIYQETAWDSTTALERVFKIGFKRKDFLFYYKLAIEEHNKSFNQNQKNDIGYFLIYEKNSEFQKNSIEEWKNYLLKASLPKEVQKEIKNGSLVLRSVHKKSEKVFLISYQIKKFSRFPKGFHNLSRANYKEPSWSEDYCYFPSLLKNKNTFYLCHVLYNYIGEKISFRFSFSNEKNKDSLLKTTIIGHPLTIGDMERSDFHFIENIVISFFCGEKKEKIKILSRIGNDGNKKNKYRNFLAPIELKHPIKCKNINQIKKLKVKFQSQIGYSEKEEIYYSYPPEM